MDTPLMRFAAYVRRAALAAGYDVDAERGGGKKRLAEAAGMSPTSISRLLIAERMPDARFLAPLAQALNVPLPQLLIESGLFPAESLTQGPQESVGSPDITPVDVAESWGVQDEAGRELLRAMHERFRREREQRDQANDGSAEAQA